VPIADESEAHARMRYGRYGLRIMISEDERKQWAWTLKVDAGIGQPNPQMLSSDLQGLRNSESELPIIQRESVYDSQRLYFGQCRPTSYFDCIEVLGVVAVRLGQILDE
jgi:hypothetical protein